MKPTRVLIMALLILPLSRLQALSAQDGDTGPRSFCEAARTGNIEEVQRHIDAGVNVNALDAVGRTPMSAAVVNGHIEVIKVLMEAGADPTLTTRQGAPFIAAISWGRLDMVQLFVDSGRVDVNATIDGLAPLTAARRQPQIAAYLREKGAVEPAAPGDSLYDMPPGGPAPTTQRPGADPYGTRPNILADPNAIRASIRAVAGLDAKLKVLDANATTEARSWRQRKIDNRTGLLRSVRQQFEDEMRLVKNTAAQEVGHPSGRIAGAIGSLLGAVSQQPATAEPNAVAAAGPALLAGIDGLVARRTQRYELISDNLREQRREQLRQERESNTAMGRGRGRSRGRATVEAAPAYPTPARTPMRPGGPESNEPPLDPDTEAQLTAWLNANPEDKRDLLSAVHEMDLAEYGALHQLAETANASETATTLAGLMLAHEERFGAILEKMAADDERLQRLAERNAGTGQDDTMSRRGRRSR